ncbi:MAG: hypothetical protein GX494_01290 [Clostridiaceae bacterium]|nr:hypothetical protein [Clostridiaceae bacterium]
MDIKGILEQLEKYLEENLAAKSLPIFEDIVLREAEAYPGTLESEMDDFIFSKKKPSFKSLLFRYIDERNLIDSEVYKKAGIDRRHFSKIRSNKDYRPGKNTVIALCLALELTRDEADALLESCGFSLSCSEIFDLIIAFCLERKIYDIDTVNLILDRYKLKPLQQFA